MFKGSLLKRRAEFLGLPIFELLFWGHSASPVGTQGLPRLAQPLRGEALPCTFTSRPGTYPELLLALAHSLGAAEQPDFSPSSHHSSWPHLWSRDISGFGLGEGDSGACLLAKEDVTPPKFMHPFSLYPLFPGYLPAHYYPISCHVSPLTVASPHCLFVGPVVPGQPLPNKRCNLNFSL